MKILLKKVLWVFAVISFFALPSCNGIGKSFLQSHVTIADLRAKQSVFADSLITLHDIQINSCESIWKYSISVITDGSGELMYLLSDKPFKTGEKTEISGRMLVIYQKGQESWLVFIDSGLKPMDDILKLVKLRVGF